jgi:hypothetical protein
MSGGASLSNDAIASRCLEASLSHRGVGCSLRGMDAVTRGERGGLLCLERGGDALRGELSKLGLGLGAFHGGLPCSLS